MTESNTTRIAFQALAIVSLGGPLFERVLRLLSEISRTTDGNGR